MALHTQQAVLQYACSAANVVAQGDLLQVDYLRLNCGKCQDGPAANKAVSQTIQKQQ